MMRECTEEEAPIGGDVLEEIVCGVALVDLVSANRVSSTWRSAISCSLSRLNTLKPWLIIHSQAQAHAYDPRSHLWMQIRKPPPSVGHYFSALRSSHSSLLYMISSSRFAFSLDPLHLHWHEPHPPIAWRPDPVVAAVGNRVIVAGSACSLIEDGSTVPPLEIYDTTSGRWESACDSMPRELMDSGASTWLSVAVAGEENKMYVSVKSSGVTYSFDPRSREWCGGYDVGMRGRGVESVFYSEIAWCGGGGGLIAVGLTGEAEMVRSVVIWEVEGEGRWRMPDGLLERVKGESSGYNYMPSISVNVMNVMGHNNFVFIHNPLEPREVISCQLQLHLRTCRWESVTTAPFDDAFRLRNLVFTASAVTLPHLEHAFALGTAFKTLQK